MTIKFTPELAEICGVHAGDGYLRGNGKWELDISGDVEEKDYYDFHLIPLLKKVFKIKIIGRYFPHRNTYGFVIRDRRVIETIHQVGFPYGAKSLTVKIPELILKDKELLISFLRGYFDTDGSLYFKRRKSGSYSIFKKTRHYYPTLSFTTISKPLVEDLKKALKKLGFSFVYYSYKSKNPKEHLQHNLYLYGNKKLYKWMKLIGIKNPTKDSRFQIWQKYGFCPVKTTYPQRLKTLEGTIDPNIFYGPVA